ncbi:MAG: hypothetical protein JHC95_15795 [Solirubrobacteraceae bacterium]|nr:hypothetical protein [Solirubrobacteraceae bacterium]
MTLRAGLLAIAVLAAAAPSAAADSYCATPATGCDHAPTSLASAITDANARAGDDVIKLGATTYSTAIPIINDSGASTGRTELVGPGAAYTTLAPPSLNGLAAIRSVDPLSISGVKITVNGASGAGAIRTIASLDASDIEIRTSGTPTTPFGIYAQGGGTVERANIAMNDGATCITGVTTARLNVRSASISDCATAVLAGGTANPGNVWVERSLVAGNLWAMRVLGGDSAASSTGLIANSLVTSSDGTALMADADDGNALFIVDHVTALPGNGTNTLLGARTTTAGKVATMGVRGSILVAGPGFTIGRKGVNGNANIQTTYSNLDDSAGEVNSTGPGVYTAGTGNTNLTPGFVSSHNFHLRPDSPLLDRDPGAILPSTSPLDFDGVYRKVGPGMDLGAYELPAAPVVPVPSITDLTIGTATVNASVDTGGLATDVEVRVYGQGPYTPYTLPKVKGAGTPVAVAQALTGLAPGAQYRVEVVATNDSGTVTSPSVLFTVPEPPAAVPGPTVLPGAGTPVAPVTTRARITGFAVLPFTGLKKARARLTLNTAATVSFRLARKRTGRKLGTRCSLKAKRGKRCTKLSVLSGKLSRKLPAGTTTLTFGDKLFARTAPKGTYVLTASIGGKAAATVSFTLR